MLTSSTFRFRLLALSLVVVLTGCRESIVADLPVPVTPPPPGGGTEVLYIKGVESILPVGGTMQIRSQSHLHAARYSWGLYGDGTVETTETQEARVVRITGRAAGPMTVSVTAYDAAGVLLASGQRRFEVVY